ncbi:MAG: dTMP kinase [Candidatus Thermoplasmatota archaeon]
MNRRGKLIVFEGIDGSGKSSSLRRVADHLRKDGLDPLVTREETETDSGAWVRRSIAEGWPPLATLHLFLADRARHVATEIAPALAAGRIVLCDRYLHSTLAYQAVTLDGILHDAPARLRALHDGWCPWPDRVVLFDSDPAKAVARTASRSSRTPYEKALFLSKVRARYLELAQAEPERFTLLDADRELSAVVADALAVVRKTI